LPGAKRGLFTKTLLIMKFSAVLLLAAIMQVSAKGYSQQVTLSLKDVPLEEVFRAIQQQTGYNFAYSDRLMKNTRPVSVQVKEATLEEVLQISFKNQPVTYSIVGKIIVVKAKEPVKVDETPASPAPPGQVKGYVSGDNGPLAGASVVIKRTGVGTSTNVKGEFTLYNVDDNEVLEVSSVGFEKQDITIKDKKAFIVVQLKLAINKLDDVQVLAYGQATSQRYSTGSIVKVTSEDIAKQPVSNVLQALTGRMSGLVVNQVSGLPGGDITFQVRGQNSISNNSSQLLSNPLVIVDGVPYPGSPVNYSQNSGNPMSIGSIVGYGSPLFNINPSDIESIEVLKDADATAIYGSRAANGVMLITTKKGKQGKTRMEANVRTGIATNLRRLDLLKTPEYLSLRREAFNNDGITPTASNAPDLFVWDTTKNIDWQKKLIGGTAKTTDADVSFAGGGNGTNFLLSGSYNVQSSIFPDDRNVKRGNIHLSLNHSSPNRKLQVTVSLMAASTKNTLPGPGYPGFAYVLPPDYPVRDSAGNLNWVLGENPEANKLITYTSTGLSLTGNAQVKYNILEGLDAKISLGYSRVQVTEDQQTPIAAVNPAYSPTATHYYGISIGQSTTVEPQLEYAHDLLKGRLDVLAGGTLEKNINESPIMLTAYGYSSDLYLSNLNLASNYSISNGYNAYQYASLFGRANYNWQNKYILTGSFRRDGSSRFGPNSQFGNFGAMGAAWVFSNEGFAKHIPWLSFGKLRSSLGWVGSDNVPNYQFMSTYTTAAYGLTYGGVAGLAPARIANDNYRWETTEKLEGALELGFLKDRILVSTAWYRNRSGNQLVGYPLSTQTGFSSYYANLNAVVQNTGLELELNTTNIKTKHFTWSTAFNVSIPSNKLVSFPGIASTAYASLYEVGKPLSAIYALHYIGNDANGLPKYEDANHNGSYYDVDGLAAYGTGDKVYSGDANPKYYGGLQNGVSWKNFRLDVFLQFTHGQKEVGYLSTSPNVGSMLDVSGKVVSELRSLGLEKFISTRYSTSELYFKYYSDAIYSDASFVRLQNVAFSWTLPDKYLKPMKMAGAKLYLQAQNLYVWHHFNGLDPETGATGLPPLFTLVGGVQLSF
jgi:TonB-linked SusC/RagA family outer membrane protein